MQSSLNSFTANSYPQSLNAPSVYFIIFPLCTRVTCLLSPDNLLACSIAFLICLWLPDLLTGFIPIPDPFGMDLFFKFLLFGMTMLFK